MCVCPAACQALAKKLIGGSGVISCMAVHPSGDHVILGSEDKRLAWSVLGATRLGLRVKGLRVLEGGFPACLNHHGCEPAGIVWGATYRPGLTHLSPFPYQHMFTGVGCQRLRIYLKHGTVACVYASRLCPPPLQLTLPDKTGTTWTCPQSPTRPCGTTRTRCVAPPSTTATRCLPAAATTAPRTCSTGGCMQTS